MSFNIAKHRHVRTADAQSLLTPSFRFLPLEEEDEEEAQ